MEARCRRFRTLHPELADRFFDLEYADLISDPVTAVRRIYRQFEIPLTELTIQRVRQLASNRSRYPSQHNLSFNDLGAGARPENREAPANMTNEFGRNFSS